MKQLPNEIVSYIKHLKLQYGFDISVHLKDEYIQYLINYENLFVYNRHLNGYCTYVKSKKFRKCIMCQYLVYEKCKSHNCFTGECHAGVLQYIYAIKGNENVLGFVCVSGYTGSKRRPTNNGIYNKNIKKEQMPTDVLNSVIPPLAHMFEILFCQTNNIAAKEGEFYKIKAFVDEYYANITLDMICKKFNYSKSYISHIFKKNTGYTVKGYCNNIKINDAKRMLINTNTSITDISYAVGFNNLSYFISLFKKEYGISPLAYRNRR